MLTRQTRKLLVQCEGRQVVLQKKNNPGQLLVWELGSHSWTRQPNPSKPIGEDKSRFDCGISWVTQRHDPSIRPLATFRDEDQPKGQWLVYIPAHFNPYNTLIEHARRYNLVSPNPNNIFIPGDK